MSSGSPRLLLRPDTSSFSSALSHSSFDESTMWGPGTLAGKAILALGEATMRGSEHLVILKRLVSITARFPCRDEDTSKKVLRMMSDVVELARPGLYPKQYRSKALRCILLQIATRQTVHLVNGLLHLQVDELMQILAEIMVLCMLPNSHLESSLKSSYLEAIESKDRAQPIGPCVDFMCKLAHVNKNTFSAVLDAGLLELILWRSHRESELSHYTTYSNSSETLVCSSSFDLLASSSPDLQQIWKERVSRFWPDTKKNPSLENILDHVNYSSPQTWCKIEAQFLECQIHSMLDALLELPLLGRTIADDTYPLLKHLSPAFHQTVQPSIKKQVVATKEALWSFLRCVAFGGHVKDIVRDHLLQRTHKHKVMILSRIIYMLIPNTPDSQGREMLGISKAIQDSIPPSTFFTQFLTDIASSHRPLLDALLDAAITVILPLVRYDMKVWKIFDDLFRRANYFPSICRRKTYGKSTKKMLAIIESSGLRDVIQDDTERSREICSALEPIFQHAFEGGKIGPEL
ncbi:hypothetical protein BDQ12DRAFT_683255 [Crucibulum laeve]|uniref:Uncharacterized protein n=1 Tax=Crucibulum laeve TaxID=68775 RepID=A0A5C3M0R9_9AGAR|nr:hypothetical protein BDQ12DRAFT_683255 [Crucibulum laeve]